ncbi:MAG TPA: hypothetical protein VFG68_09195 [Fimbriiglobus sp.]|nr:hypothetical protein [Fimbriiglobus sp.]
MQVKYSDAVKHSGEDFALLQQATRQLAEVLGPSAGLVESEWDRSEDARDRTLYTLTIRDWTGKTQTQFSPDELTYPGHVRIRLHHLWGGLLQARYEQDLQSLQASSGV